MVRGTAYGVGVQIYMWTGDMERAIYETWLAYDPEVEDPPKTFMAKTINNLLQSREKLDELRKSYEVAEFNNQPAIELSFRLNLDTKWYYVGYIDLVLRSKLSGLYGVLEVKTTGNARNDLTPLYQNSGQALGYSIILDQIAGADQATFETPYLVCRDLYKGWIPDVQIFPFKRTLMDRFKWFLSLGMDLERLNNMLALNHFPMRQKGCLAYGKVCPHFGFCSMTATDKYIEAPEDKSEYQFIYNLTDVIADHVRRISI